MLDDMADAMETLGLPEGIEASLASKLANAAASIRRGRDAAASGRLDAFLAELRALGGMRLSEDLVESAAAMVELIRFPDVPGLPPLLFPFASPSDVERLAAFGIPDWSGTEPHNGIDLVVDEGLPGATVISPVRGCVRSIQVRENPYSVPVNQLILMVEIFVNSEWTVALVFEPSCVDEITRAEQIAAIGVAPGQTVEAGQAVGALVVGDLGYPHLHFSLLRDKEFACAYEASSDPAKAIYEEIAARTGSDICE